jgi:hypothetical protein
MANNTPRQASFMLERLRLHPDWSLAHHVEDTKKNHAEIFPEVSTASGG